MRKILFAALAVVVALSLVGPALADHEDAPGESQFGRCTALLHGTGNGKGQGQDRKWENGRAFDIFDDVEDGSDEGSSDGDLADAIEYCEAYVEDNHPGNP